MLSPENIKKLAAVIQQLLGQPWLGLRPDLTVHSGAADNSGLSRWYIEDPITADRFALGVEEYKLVTALAARNNLADALTLFQKRHGYLPESVDLANILRVFVNDNLAVRPATMDAPADAAKPPLWRKLYSLKIPVLQPDKWLDLTLPLFGWLGSQWLRWMLVLAAAIGLGLIVPQSDRFFATTGYLLTPQGIAALLITLVFLKIGHEFCHAYVAKYYGLHVRSMGVIFIFFWPILYTDATDAWRLKDRQKRLNIAIAGIVFELSLAALALLLWPFLPPGLPQNIAFMVAFTSVLGTLLINANPFMKFDGYYALMDWWAVDNLQTRSTALTKHYWRRLAVDWQSAIPEEHHQTKRLALFGLGVWLYRLILAVVIALAGYALINAWVGIILFLVVISGMLIGPILGEWRQLIKLRKQWGNWWRPILTVLALIGVITLLVIPLPRDIQTPSLLFPEQYVRIQADSAGQLAVDMPQVGDSFRQGQTVTRLASPSLVQEVMDADFKLQQIDARRQALLTGGEEGGYRNWLLAEQRRLQAKRATALKAGVALSLKTTIDGTVRYVHPNVKKGDWVSAGLVLAELSNKKNATLRVYLNDQQVNQMVPKMVVVDCPGMDFSSEKDRSNASLLGSSENLVATGLDMDDMIDLQDSELIAVHNGLEVAPVVGFLNEAWYDKSGGPVATKQSSASDEVLPRDAWYSADYTVTMDASVLPLGQPCWATLTSENRSIAGRLINVIARQLSDDGVW